MGSSGPMVSLVSQSMIVYWRRSSGLRFGMTGHVIGDIFVDYASSDSYTHQGAIEYGRIMLSLSRE